MNKGSKQRDDAEPTLGHSSALLIHSTLPPDVTMAATIAMMLQIPGSMDQVRC